MSQKLSAESTKYWTVRRRIWGSYAVVILITVGLGSYAYSRLLAIRSEATRLSQGCLPAVALINQIDSLSGQVYALTLKHTVTGDPAMAERILNQIKAELEQMNQFAERFESTISTPQEREALNAIKAARTQYATASVNVLLSDPAKPKEKLETVRSELELAYQHFQNAIDAAVELKRSQGALASTQISHAAAGAQTGILVGIAASLLLALVSGVFLVRAIDQPLARLVEAMDGMRLGDFTRRLTLARRDEFGNLADGFNQMAESISALFSQVQKSGIQVTTSATGIAATSKQQQATASQIAATTTEIGATSNEISATSQELVKTLQQVTRVAEQTGELAGNGQEGLARMQATMQQIMEASGSIAAKLSVLNEKAGSIGTVVTTISKVADQTNLLSLNAAIEAEKAGQSGLGFAVVATEIRRLADQTAVATGDIEQMVKEMQSAVSAGVMGMDKFTEAVRKGVSDVHQVGTQLGQIIEQVQALTPRFEAVNEGMQAQAIGAQQICEALAHLSESAQQTADSLQESHQVIERLNEASRGLQEGVGRFKLAA